MPATPVIVAIAPPESPAELRRALLSACGQAVKVAECVEPNAEGGAPDGAIVATVIWRGAEHVRLEVRLQSANQTVEREIDFASHDAPEERWKTTGLVVGTLASVLSRNELPSVGELPEAPEKEATPPLREEAPAPNAKPEPSQNAREVLLRPPHTHRHPGQVGVRGVVNLSALVAPAIAGGPFRLGGELGGRLRSGSIPVEPALAVAYSEALSDLRGVHVRFFDAFIGFAVTGALGGPFSCTARGEGFVRWLEARTEPSGSLDQPEQARALGGARVGLDGSIRVANAVSFFAGAAGLFAAGSTDISVRGRNVGNVPALSYELRLGASLEL